jgi:APA family basic amino acid/polyamine antiporter
LQAAIAVVMILTASYNKLLIYIGFTLSLFAMLTVIGMMMFRIKRPPSETYQTFGYPLTPLLFILGNMWIIYYSVRSRPVPALAGLITIGCGVGVYYFFNRIRKVEKIIPEIS